MSRRSFSREFKLEAVRLVSERGLTVAQAARDLDLHENVLRKWVRQYCDDPAHAFTGAGQLKPEQAGIAQLKKEVRKLKAERDILKKPRLTSRRIRSEVRVYREASRDLAGDMDVRGTRCLAERLLQLALKTAKRSNIVRRAPDPRYPSQLHRQW
jgi:transposase